MSLKKLISVAIAGASLAMVASPAQAAETIVVSGASGTFGNDQVTCGGVVSCAFTNTFDFLTPIGFNLANATISTSAISANGVVVSNIDFGSVLLNGTAFTLTPTGTFEFGTLANKSLLPGALNTITVNGQNTGDGSFAGTLVFAAVPAVPEPGTWAMMLLGFGAIGIGMRRRKLNFIPQAA